MQRFEVHKRFYQYAFFAFLIGFIPLSLQSRTLDKNPWEVSFEYILDQHYLTVGSETEKFLTIGSALLNAQTIGPRQFFSISVMGNHGGHSPTRDLGDLQIVSNIDTEGVESIRIYELVYGRFIGEWEVSLGWKDLSLTINVTNPALLFVHSSFGTTAEWGGAGFRGPSIYPIPSFGLYFDSGKSLKNFYLRGAVTDPISEETYYPKQMQSHVRMNLRNHMAVIESGWEPSQYSQIALGAWNMELEQGVLQDAFSQTGVYFQSHSQIGNHLVPFLRYGKANKFVGRLFENKVVGVKLNDFFKEADLGAGYTWAAVGGIRTPEEVYEITLQHSLSQWLKVQLSQQVVINPALGNEDGTLSTLRIFFSL